MVDHGVANLGGRLEELQNTRSDGKSPSLYRLLKTLANSLIERCACLYVLARYRQSAETNRSTSLVDIREPAGFVPVRLVLTMVLCLFRKSAIAREDDTISIIR